MGAIRGVLTIAYDDDGTVRTIARLQSATLDVQTRLLPAASPVGYGWEHFAPGQQGWTVQARHLQWLAEGEDFRLVGQRRLEQLAFDRTLLPVRLETGHATWYEGTAYVERMTVGAVTGDVAAGEYALRGAGPLLEFDAGELSPCGAATVAGSNDPTETEHYIGLEAGWVHMPWYGGNAIPDLFEIVYDGEVVATTEVPVIEHGVLSWYYPAEIARPRSVMVRVTPDPNPNTFWSYILSCPVASDTYTGPQAPTS